MSNLLSQPSLTNLDGEEKYNLIQTGLELARNMGKFGQTCFPKALRRTIPDFHQEIYKSLLDTNTKRVMIAAPRGTAKSTVCSLILPLYMATFKQPAEELFIVIISESQAQSINFLSRIKYHLAHSEIYRTLYGARGSDTAAKWTGTDIVLKNGTRMVAVGTGQRVRGFIQGDTRPNLIIVDDFESELNAATPEARSKNRKWMTEAVIPSLADDGRIIMIGTVISEDCFICWAKESSAWKTLWYAIWDDDEKPIWNARFPKERIIQIKEEFESVGNLNGFYQEYMNIAQSPDNAPFKPEYVKLHHYDFKRIEGQNCLVKKRGSTEHVKPIEIYCGIDPASSLNPRADFFVISVIGIDNDNNKYIVDLFRERISPAEQPGKIIEYYKKYRPKRMKVETTAYQEALRASTRAMMLKENLYIPGLEKGVKPRTRKSERLISLVPMLAKGEFFFRPQDLTAQQEFLSYPKGRNDDILDAIWIALEGATPCRKKKIEKQTDDGLGKKLLDWMTM